MTEQATKRRGRPKKVEGPKFRVYAVRKVPGGAGELVEAHVPESVIAKYEVSRRQQVTGLLPDEVSGRIEEWLMGRAKW